MKPAIRGKDLLWGLAVPLYWILGTLRHEGSHALVGILCGARLKEFIYWPTHWHGQFYWGYVLFDGTPPVVATAAPYFVDVLLVLASAWVCVRWFAESRALWINVVALGLVAPTIDLTYNFIMAVVFRHAGDVVVLITALGFVLVDATFFLALIICSASFAVVFEGRSSAPVDRHPTAQRLRATGFWLLGINAAVLVGTFLARAMVGAGAGPLGLMYYVSAGAFYLIALGVLTLPLLEISLLVPRRAAR